jgi:SnoaL-like domain
MSKHVAISPEETADRLAIRELIEAYARCADRRDATGQMALFTTDTHFVVYMNAKDPKPSQELNSSEALAPVFADLNRMMPPRISSDRAPSSRSPLIAPQGKPTASRITSR